MQKVACLEAAVIVVAVAYTIFGVAVTRHWFSIVVCLQSMIVIVYDNSRLKKN